MNLVGLVPGRTPGLERWALDTLPVLGAARPDVDWVAFLGREGRRALGWDPFGPHVRTVRLRVTAGRALRRAIGTQVVLPQVAALHKVDVLLTPAAGAPRRIAVRTVVVDPAASCGDLLDAL